MAKKPEKEVVVTPELKIEEISKDLVKVEKDALKIVVKTQEDYENASKFLASVVKTRIARITEVMEFFTNPYLEQRRVALAKKQEIEEMFGAKLKPLTDIEATIKGAMRVFLREQDELARKEEARLLALREKQDAKREEKGLEPIAMPVAVVERPQATVRAEGGSKTTARKVWNFQVVNPNLVPREFLVVDEKAIGRAVTMGIRAVDGVNIFEDFDISATAGRK